VRADHHRKRTAGQSKTDDHAGRQIEGEGRVCVRHPGQTQRVEDRARAQHADRTEAIGDRTGERLRCAPKQILHGNRE